MTEDSSSESQLSEFLYFDLWEIPDFDGSPGSVIARTLLNFREHLQICATYMWTSATCQMDPYVQLSSSRQGRYYTPHPPVAPQRDLQRTCEHRQHVKCWNEGTQQLHEKTHARRRWCSKDQVSWHCWRMWLTMNSMFRQATLICDLVVGSFKSAWFILWLWPEMQGVSINVNQFCLKTNWPEQSAINFRTSWFHQLEISRFQGWF